MTVAVADNALPVSVVTALYLRTKKLHVEAERTGIIRELLRGEASLEGYILLLRNLLPAYQAIEQGLKRHSASEGLSAVANFGLDRASAIEADLVELCGHGWERDIPLLDAGDIYARRIAKVADGDGMRLIAHAYTRYLGDLSGGQILQRLLARSLNLKPAQLTFYDFPKFSDISVLKTDFRNALDAAGTRAADPRAIVEEGVIAFSLNIDLSCAVQAQLSSGPIAATAAE